MKVKFRYIFPYKDKNAPILIIEEFEGTTKEFIDLKKEIDNEIKRM